MEHGALADPIIESVSENLIHTYLELGNSMSGAHVWREEGFVACTGKLDHPICNFAADLRPSPATARRLREVAARRNSFSVYALPPYMSGLESLHAEGFTVSHQLAMMVSGQTLDDRVELEPVDPSGRLKIAEFISEQFFHRQPTGFRRGIAQATAAAPSLKLFRAKWNQRTAGAVMISEHAGIIGLYNLCVAPHFRSRGWGSAIVRTIVGEAAERGLSVTLQCEPSLASWYSSLGFKEVGSVSVFGLCRLKEIDIMG